MPTSALAKDADSRKERWHPSPQFINVLDPSGDIISREGLESIEAVVRIRMEAVMMVSSNHMLISSLSNSHASFVPPLPNLILIFKNNKYRNKIFY